jgi:hypothetical protein
MSEVTVKLQNVNCFQAFFNPIVAGEQSPPTASCLLSEQNAEFDNT